jgi:protein-S-isoprenylcysteine O-methyltransferase Ste14
MRSGASVSRWVATSAFALLAAGTAMNVGQAVQDAVAEPALRAALVGGYWVLKLAVVLAFTVFVLLRGPSRRPSRDPVAFISCTAAIVAVVALQPPGDSTSTALVLAGDLLTLVSCAWLLAAVLALGRCFGILPEARGLVTRGPYRLVRHPVYLGELGAAAGLVVASPTLWNLGALAVFACAQAVRMPLEERALSAEFPEYHEYAARTPRLMPRLLARRAPQPVGSGKAL